MKTKKVVQIKLSLFVNMIIHLYVVYYLHDQYTSTFTPLGAWRMWRQYKISAQVLANFSPVIK